MNLMNKYILKSSTVQIGNEIKSLPKCPNSQEATKDTNDGRIQTPSLKQHIIVSKKDEVKTTRSKRSIQNTSKTL